MKLQAVILEDRPLHRDELLAQLARWPQAERLELRCAASAEELRDLLRQAPADILLTDIDLGSGQSTGISLVQELLPANSRTQVIYITGYPLRFCTEVYRTEHIYFLKKPLQQDALFDSLDRAAENLSRLTERQLVIRSAGQLISLSTAQLHYAESDRRLARLYTTQGVLETYTSLTALLPQLGPAFVQCHKSYLVNLSQVARLEPDCLHLKSGVTVPVSRSCRRQTRDAYLDYLARQL